MIVGVGGESAEKKNKYIYISPSDIFFMLLINVLAASSIYLATELSSYISILLFLLYYIYLYKKNFRAAMALLPLMFLFVFEFISVFGLEIFKSYMKETGQFGALTGGTSRIIAIDSMAIFFFSAASPCFNIVVKTLGRRGAIPIFYEYVIFIVGVIFILYYAVFGIKSGFPLITGEERFLFRRQAGEIFDSMLNNRTVPLLLLATVKARGTHKNLAQGLAITLIVLIGLLGEKFTSTGLYVCQYVSVILVLRGRPASYASLVAGIVMVGGVIVSITLASYAAGENLDNALSLFMERAALNGQAWFLADQQWLAGGGGGDYSVLSNELWASIDLTYRGVDKINEDFGLYRFMAIFAFRDIFRYYRTDEIGFIFTLVPQWTLFYGMSMAAIMAAFSYVAYFSVFMSLVVSISRYNVVMVVIFSKMITWNLNGRIVGYSYLIFGIEQASVVILYFYLAFIKSWPYEIERFRKSA